jgi:hypothetical protein
MVKGENVVDAQPSSRSGHSPRETDPVCLLMIGAEVDGSTIPEVVPVVPEPKVAAGATSEPTEIADGVAPGVDEEVRDDVLPGSNLEVVIRSPEIQDAEPICSAPMSEVAATSRGGLELLADDLVDPATVAGNLEAMQQAEQWMKVHDCTLELSSSSRKSTQMIVAFCRMLWRGPERSLKCSRGMEMRCSGQKH